MSFTLGENGVVSFTVSFDTEILSAPYWNICANLCASSRNVVFGKQKVEFFLIASAKLRAEVVICSSTVILGKWNKFVSDYRNVSAIINLFVFGTYKDKHL